MECKMPRQFLNKMKLREKAIGRDRRENFAKEILHKDTPLPKPLEYTDIDASFKDFVSDTLDIAYEGKRLPTFTLFSNQRFSEYSQTWEHVDENRNLLMNFKTISREIILDLEKIKVGYGTYQEKDIIQY